MAELRRKSKEDCCLRRVAEYGTGLQPTIGIGVGGSSTVIVVVSLMVLWLTRGER